jgi:hypothetical protein
VPQVSCSISAECGKGAQPEQISATVSLPAILPPAFQAVTCARSLWRSDLDLRAAPQMLCQRCSPSPCAAACNMCPMHAVYAQTAAQFRPQTAHMLLRILYAVPVPAPTGRLSHHPIRFHRGPMAVQACRRQHRLPRSRHALQQQVQHCTELVCPVQALRGSAMQPHWGLHTSLGGHPYLQLPVHDESLCERRRQQVLAGRFIVATVRSQPVHKRRNQRRCASVALRTDVDVASVTAGSSSSGVQLQ